MIMKPCGLQAMPPGESRESMALLHTLQLETRSAVKWGTYFKFLIFLVRPVNSVANDMEAALALVDARLGLNYTQGV